MPDATLRAVSRHKTSIFGGLLLLVVTLILALGLFEGVSRLVGVDFNPNPNWRYHPTLGWSQERDLVYDTTIDGDDVHIEFNSMGFRDVEHTLEKPAGTRRIVILGDSFSEAVQVNLEETYWHRLQQLLNQSQTQPWEVINLGVGDFGTAQALIALEKFGLGYSPDLVISQIFPLNDICNNSIELAGMCKSRNDDFRPYFVERDGVLQATSTHPWRFRLRRWLVSFGVVEKTLLTLLRPSESVEEIYVRRYQEKGYPAGPLLFTYAPEADQIGLVARGWKTTEALLARIAEICESRSIAWLPVVIPFEIRVGPAWNNFAVHFPHIPMVQDYPEERLDRFLSNIGVHSLMLKPVFEGHQDVFFPGRGGHLNPGAHALAAQAIHDKLLESGFIR